MSQYILIHCYETNQKYYNWKYIDGLVQKGRNFSVLAIDLHLSCTKLSICTVYSRYIVVVYIAELDVSQSHVGPYILVPKNATFFVKSQ